MFEIPLDQRFAGVFTFLIDESKLLTFDFERTYFEVNGKGEIGVEFAPDLEGEMDDLVEEE